MKISNFKLFFKLPLAGQISNFITHPLFSGSAIMVFGSNSVSFLNYLYHLIMGRMLGPSNYGELASLISIMGLLGIIPGSVSLVIVKYISSAKSKEEVNNLVGWLKHKIFIASLVFFIVILITSPTISSFLNIRSISYLVLIAISFLFSLQSALNRSILQGLLKFKEMMISILAENTTKLVISIFLVYVGFAVSGTMSAFAIAAILGFYITNLFLKGANKENAGMSPNIKSMLFFTIPVLIQSFALTSIYSSDVILVKHFFSSHEAGIYASLSTLGKIIFFATGPISAVMFPLVSQRKSRGQTYRKVFIFSFILTSLFAITISIIYWIFPQFAIRLLYGSAYLEAEKLLVWFGIFISLFTLSALIINYGLSLGKTRIVLLPLVASCLQIILVLLFHGTLFEVILISTIVTALLLTFLLIYLSLMKGASNADKFNITNSASL